VPPRELCFPEDVEGFSGDVGDHVGLKPLLLGKLRKGHKAPSRHQRRPRVPALRYALEKTAAGRPFACFNSLLQQEGRRTAAGYKRGRTAC